MTVTLNLSTFCCFPNMLLSKTVRQEAWILCTLQADLLMEARGSSLFLFLKPHFHHPFSQLTKKEAVAYLTLTLTPVGTGQTEFEILVSRWTAVTNIFPKHVAFNYLLSTKLKVYLVKLPGSRSLKIINWNSCLTINHSVFYGI